MTFINEVLAMPEFKAVFNIRSPLDLVGIGFFFLLMYTVVGGTLSMLRNQARYIAHALMKRRAPAVSECHPYTQSLINGSAPELYELRNTKDRARRGEILRSVIHTLDEQDASPIARAVVKSLRARL